MENQTKDFSFAREGSFPLVQRSVALQCMRHEDNPTMIIKDLKKTHSFFFKEIVSKSAIKSAQSNI